MKKIIYILAAVFSLSACHGYLDTGDGPEQGGDEPGTEIPEEYVGPYTLSVDKDEVEADGKDLVTFSLKDKYGRDLMLDRKALQNINITCETAPRVPRMESATRFIANGTFVYSAKYSGAEAANTVSIVAKNRGKYETFHKNVALYKLTGTQCPYCPSMTKAIKGMNEDAQAHFIELDWHTSQYSTKDLVAYSGTSECASTLLGYIGGQGFPTAVLDLKQKVTERSSSTFENAIWNLRAEYPATCGIKLSAVHDAENSRILINAELKSSTGGEYDMGFVLLLNNQIIPGSTEESKTYSHIVRATTGNYYMYNPKAIAKVAKNGTAEYEQIIELENITDLEDYSVAAFALVKDGDKARIDNIVEVEVGKSVDYKYNE